MSSERKFELQDPNLVSVRRDFEISIKTGTSTDQTFSLWRQEFKFGFEYIFGAFKVINLGSRPVWINRYFTNDRRDYLPKKVESNGTIYDLSYSARSVDGVTQVKFTLWIVLGIDYNAEPSHHQDLRALLEGNKFSDVKLKFGDEEFSCHKSILAARSPVLSQALEFGFAEDELEIKGINPPAEGFASDSLERFLDVLYTGRTAPGPMDASLKVLADYFDIKQSEEHVPELRPILHHREGNLQKFKDWDTFAFSLRHKVQMEPSIAAKNVELSWTVANFDAWRETQPANHVEQLPEKRITFLGKEYALGCQLQLSQHSDDAASALVNRGEGPAFITVWGDYNPMLVLSPNSFREFSRLTKFEGDDLVVKFKITLYEFLDLGQEFPHQLDFRKLFDPEKGNQFADIKLSCRGEEFACHKAILAARSPAFAQIFDENPDADRHEIQDSVPARVKQMLEFIYSETLRGEADLDLLKLAKKFEIKGLIKFCGRSLAKTLTLTNALDLLDEAYNQQDGSLKNLRDSVLDFCVDNFEQLSMSDQWWQREPNKRRELDMSGFMFHKMNPVETPFRFD